jgi:hypothetical protein
MQVTNRKKLFIKLSILLIFSCLGFNFVIAQNVGIAQVKDSVQIDKTNVKVEKVPWDKINKYKNSKAFDYNLTIHKDFSLWSRILYWLEELLSKIFSKHGVAPYLRLLFVLLVLAFIIYKIIGSNISGIFSRNKKLQKSNGFDYFDEDIHNQDLDKNLSDAIAAQNYRKAIRFYYLKLLKQLDLNGLIEWKISKTNYDYQRELTNNGILNDFKILSGIYEYTWYGNFEVDQMHFGNWQSDFQSAIKLTSKK